MRKGRRSAERLSYWPELGSRALTRREQEMPRSFAVNNKCFPMAAKFVISLVLVVLMALTFSTRLQAQGPALTTVSGTVYRADGTTASGTVLISWPSFQTPVGDAVAAAKLRVNIAPLGAFTAQLVPNVGASPAGTYYVVVFQLDDGTVRTEYWAVPATSPTTIAAVLTTPATGLGNLAATQQYVNTAVATRALDATVVHLAGSETITGTKHFAVPPALPAPAGANDAANKGYVDAAVANVGAGAYVSKAGDTMSGPLTLPADLTGETSTSHLGHRPYRMSTSFAWNFLHQTEFLSSRQAWRGGTDTYGAVQAYAKVEPSQTFPFGYAPGATGGAWSWRRAAFDTVGWNAGYLRLGQRRLASSFRLGTSDKRGRRNEEVHRALRGSCTQLAGARRETEPDRRPLPNGVHRQFRDARFSRQQSAARLWRAVGAPAKMGLQSRNRHRSRLSRVVALDWKQTWTPR